MTASAFPGTLENIVGYNGDSFPLSLNSGELGSGNEVVVRISNLPTDMTAREFKLMFSFCRPVVQTDFHLPSHTGLVFISDVEQAKDVHDSLSRRIPEIAGSLVEIVSSNAGDSPNSIATSNMHISPRSSAFSPTKIGRLSGSSGKRTILGEDKDSISSILSSRESVSIAEPESEFFESVMNRRASSQPLYSNVANSSLNGLAALGNALPGGNGSSVNSYPPPLASPGISNLATPIGATTPTLSQFPSQNGLSSNPVSASSTSPSIPTSQLNSATAASIPINAQQPQMNFQRVMPPVNPADQNPPCNTLYVGNLPMNASEDELKALFSKQKGYKRLCFRTKSNGPMCFVEFEDVAHATRALSDLYGRSLSNSVKGGIRLSFSKNPLGVRNNSNGAGMAASDSDRRTSSGGRQQHHYINSTMVGTNHSQGNGLPGNQYNPVRLPFST